MTPQLDTVARSLISEPPLTSPFLRPAAVAEALPWSPPPFTARLWGGSSYPSPLPSTGLSLDTGKPGGQGGK